MFDLGSRLSQRRHSVQSPASVRARSTPRPRRCCAACAISCRSRLPCACANGRPRADGSRSPMRACSKARRSRPPRATSAFRERAGSTATLTLALVGFEDLARLIGLPNIQIRGGQGGLLGRLSAMLGGGQTEIDGKKAMTVPLRFQRRRGVLRPAAARPDAGLVLIRLHRGGVAVASPSPGGGRVGERAAKRVSRGGVNWIAASTASSTPRSPATRIIELAPLPPARHEQARLARPQGRQSSALHIEGRIPIARGRRTAADHALPTPLAIRPHPVHQRDRAPHPIRCERK